MRVLVTRSAPDVDGDLARLAKRGHQGIACPLFHTEPVPGARISVGDAQAVLVTSRTGVRALAGADPERGVPLLAVGDATAEAARGCGYAQVESAGGDWLALAALARRRLNPARGPILHAGGAAVAGDLVGALGAEGFAVDHVALYRARARETLPRAGREALEDGGVEAVLLFSPRTAATFARLVAAASLGARCSSLEALCISPNVAKAAAPLPWRRARAADTPDSDSLYRLLDSCD